MPLTNPVQRIAVVLERLESPSRPPELPPPISSDEPLDDIASGYAEFLRLSDGAVCGKHRRHPAVVSGLRAADAVGGRRASVVRGDATRLASLLPAALAGQVALVVTSPPYGPTVHGLVRPGTDGVTRFDNTYGTDRGNLAYRDLTGLTDGFEQILTGCATALRPGGTVVVTARPWRKNGQLVDLPSAVIAAGLRAGLVPTERCVALLAAVRDGHLVARPSFFQLQTVRKARTGGIPLHLITHEDVLIFRQPPISAHCGGPKAAHAELQPPGGSPSQAAALDQGIAEEPPS